MRTAHLVAGACRRAWEAGRHPRTRTVEDGHNQEESKMSGFRNAIALIAASAALAIAPLPAQAQAPKTLRIATLQGAAQPSYKGLVKMAEIVDQRSNGTLKVALFGDGQLGTEQE